MADNENKKAGPPRIALNDYKSARHSLARILRMYFRKEIDTEHFRNLCYGLNILLSFDKFEKETELERRLGELENKNGQIVLKITPEEAVGLDGYPYPNREEKAGYIKPEEAEAVLVPDDPAPLILEAQPTQPRRLKL
jgi:hypothetical protein